MEVGCLVEMKAKQQSETGRIFFFNESSKEEGNKNNIFISKHSNHLSDTYILIKSSLVYYLNDRQQCVYLCVKNTEQWRAQTVAWH